jgi:hypothetical protein
MNQSAIADLVLSNGAEVNFGVGQDRTGNPVVTYLQISFPRGKQVPQGGVSATLLREITISELLTLWFQESSRSFLTAREEELILVLHLEGGDYLLSTMRVWPTCM